LIETVGLSDTEELGETVPVPTGTKRSAPEPSEEDLPPKKKVKDTPKEQEKEEEEEEEEKKQEEEKKEEEASKSENTADAVNSVPEATEKTKAPKEEKATPKEEKPAEKKKSTPNKKKNKKRKKFTFQDNGVGTRTLKAGSGAAAKDGDSVRVRYIGQLENGEIFDKNLGEGFLVTLGAGDVIKGWEVGLEGIKVDEKRKLIIPADLAYGEQGDERFLLTQNFGLRWNALNYFRSRHHFLCEKFKFLERKTF